jgi:hypothetical protein
MGCPSITTTGTVSLPSATDRTNAAASGSAQILIWWTGRRCQRKVNRSRRQNMQPGRQYSVTSGPERGNSAGSLTRTVNHRSPLYSRRPGRTPLGAPNGGVGNIARHDKR